MRRLPSTHRNAKVRHDRDVRALYRLALLLCCGLVLAGGFVFAARQHFAAVQFGFALGVLVILARAAPPVPQRRSPSATSAN